MIGLTLAALMLTHTEPDVRVCVDWGNASAAVYQPARVFTGAIIGRAGVTIQWKDRRFCRTSPGDAVMIQFVEGPRNRMPGALACAMPYEGVHIQVFYDRIQGLVGPSLLPQLLAHVLAHEIGHMLQGLNRHSASGIMKARWTGNDYHAMARQYFSFTQEDIELIHVGMRVRAARTNRAAAR